MKDSIHVYKNGKRFHKTPLGTLPGVTTILSATKDDYSLRSLESWKESVGWEVAEGIFKNSTERGNELHLMIEYYLTDYQAVNDNEQAYQLWQMFKPFLDELKAEKGDRYIERNTYHSSGFAGTPDLVMEYKGKMTIFDWKNSRKPKKRSYIKDYLQQVAAYSQSFEQTTGIKVEQGFICCGVLPDQFLKFTNPGMDVKPEFQMFKVTPKQLVTHYSNFRKRLEQFQDELENPNWEALF